MTETVLGRRYRLEEQIGRGGMASVWRATDTVLDRPVAVKRLHAGLLDDEELAVRFDREARLVARLSHPNLVHLLDRGDDEHGPYLVLELIDGEDLKARVRRDGALPPEEAARVCSQVARALAYAHANGIVHRDIKAQNVLLARHGGAKLADFGIARLLEAGGEPGLTRTDMMIGSADYLAPEQAEGGTVDARTDIYSLGIVLYECLTGQLPFPGEGFVAMAMRHVNDPLPDPRTVQPSVPAPLATVAARAAEKDPEARFQSAAELAEALDLAAQSGGTAIMRLPPLRPSGDRPADPDEDTGRAPRRRRRRAAVAAAAALVLVAGAAGAGIVLRGEEAPPPPPASVPAGPVEPITLDAIVDHDPEGDGQELSALRGLVLDGDPATTWTTERYESTAFGGLKTGVGLLLRPPEPRAATELVIDSPSVGAAFQVLGPRDAEDRRAVLAEGTFQGGAQTVPLRTAEPLAVYLLWITELVPGDDGKFGAEIGEVSLRGPANP